MEPDRHVVLVGRRMDVVEDRDGHQVRALAQNAEVEKGLVSRGAH